MFHMEPRLAAQHFTTTPPPPDDCHRQQHHHASSSSPQFLRAEIFFYGDNWRYIFVVNKE
jgi:hypothetical protein